MMKEYEMAEENQSVESIVGEICRNSRKKYSAQEKVRIVLEGLRGEVTIAELCRREGIHPNMYDKWSKDFLEAGKQRLMGDTHQEADNQEVREMRTENEKLKAVVAELTLKNCILKKAYRARKRSGTNDSQRRGRKARDHSYCGAFCLERIIPMPVQLSSLSSETLVFLLIHQLGKKLPHRQGVFYLLLYCE
jgi:transposase